MSKLLRYTYIDALRVIASVMVVAVHVVMHYIYIFQTRSISWTLLVIAKAITQFAVPVFFMVSGAVILSSSKEEPYWQFIKRRLSKIAIPFLAYSIIYYLFYVFVKGTYEFGILEFVRRFIGGDILGQLWYLYALIPLYFLYPIIRKLVKAVSRKELLTFIIVMFCLNSILPFLNELLSLFSDFSINYYSFGRAGVYLNYTLIGYYIHSYVEPKAKTTKNILLCALTGLVCVAFMTCITYWVSDKNIDETWVNIILPPVVILSVAVMLAVKYWFSSNTVSERTAVTISKFGMLSFSAYLIHMLILRIAQIFMPRSYLDNFSTYQAALILLVEFVIGLLLSYLWAFLVSKIPIIKKIL